jgi:hypothetical protein
VKKIFVKPSFIQQNSDEILYETEEFVAILVSSVTKYKKFRVYPTDEEVTKSEHILMDKYTKELNQLCDQKSKGVKFLIAGMDVSVEQMEEYELVKKAVESNDVDFFKDEALLFGTTAQEEFDKAKEAKDGYLLAYNSAKKLIRVFRRTISSNIKTLDFKTVQKMIDEGKLIGLNDDSSAMQGSPLEILGIVKQQVFSIIKNKGELIEEKAE